MLFRRPTFRQREPLRLAFDILRMFWRFEMDSDQPEDSESEFTNSLEYSLFQPRTWVTRDAFNSWRRLFIYWPFSYVYPNRIPFEYILKNSRKITPWEFLWRIAMQAIILRETYFLESCTKTHFCRDGGQGPYLRDACKIATSNRETSVLKTPKFCSINQFNIPSQVVDISNKWGSGLFFEACFWVSAVSRPTRKLRAGCSRLVGMISFGISYDRLASKVLD